MIEKLTLIGAALSLCACVTTPDYRAAGRQLNGSTPGELALQVMSRAEYDTAVSAAAMPGGPNSARGRAVQRDLVMGFTARSDVECEDYLAGISVVANSSRASLSLGGLALGTAGAVATPERSAKLLSQLSLLTGTSATALRDSVFEGRDFQIIYTAVQTGRRRDRDRLHQRVETGGFDGWGYHSLVAAVTPYHLNCGLNYGLQQITEAVEEQARRSEGGSQPPSATPPADTEEVPPEQTQATESPR